ncbi:MAG: redox-sensing transcriptional repressor Rex [bacterium]|nr:redox-sensing transcriptional repressor Rex [bacterium]
MNTSRNNKLNPNVVGRLSLYRRILQSLAMEGQAKVFSHALAKRAGVTASQVRRDLMTIGYTGSPSSGYDVVALGEATNLELDAPTRQPVMLLGVGNLGRAVLEYFHQAHARLEMVAAVDVDPEKVGRVISGVATYSAADLPDLIKEKGIDVAILTLPASRAQEATDLIVGAGVHSLLNFTNVRLRVPDGVFVENMDIGIALAKVAYYGRREEGRRGE